MSDKYIMLTNNGVERPFTAEEITARKAEETEANSNASKLENIKKIRLQKLIETDWWVLRGNMTDEQILYRKNLRDIPTNYNSSKYNELLARETDTSKNNHGELTHSIWSKP
tara:strand:+ start:164 stop:499 length:336 start_codon:yes stop_codon:yes gene_type:complete